MELLHLLVLGVISIICFKIGQQYGKKEVEIQQSKYIQLQENETLIEEYQDPDEFKKQVEVQEKEFKKAIQELNELNQKEKQNKILLDQLKKLPKQVVKKKGIIAYLKNKKTELISDKEFEQLIDGQYDGDINENELDQELIAASK